MYFPQPRFEVIGTHKYLKVETSSIFLFLYSICGNDEEILLPINNFSILIVSSMSIYILTSAISVTLIVPSHAKFFKNALKLN